MGGKQYEARRVAITGVGLICPLGMTPESFWDALLARKSGVFPIENLAVPFAGQALEFTGSIEDFGPLDSEQKKAIRKGLKVMSRESQMGLAAAQRALADAGITPGAIEPDRAGASFGSDYMLTDPRDFTQSVPSCTTNGRFDASQWATAGIPQMSPLWLLKYLPNMPGSHIAIYNDFRGPNNSITLREAAGNLSIGEAFRTIGRGAADLMVAGATGTRIHPMKAVHAIHQEEISTHSPGAEASRPFDARRDGMVLGEGAGAIVLEDLEKALARGARIYAEVVGASSSAVGRKGAVARRAVALTNVLRGSLRDAEMRPDEIGHIHAHGLSTRSCDREEAEAIRTVFENGMATPVTAAKSYFGNLGAASGVVELIASMLAMQNGRLFPVLNYVEPDAELGLNIVAGDDATPGDSFVNLSVTPQGQASAVVVRKYSE